MTSSDASGSKRICMVSYSFYESDNRIIRYAETLSSRGDSVEVVALRRTPDLPRVEMINGVRVHRIQDRFGKDGSSALSFLWPLLRFLVASARWLERNGRSPKFDLVHIHNIPDFMIFAGLPAKMRGARLILDIHDIVPEFYASKFGVSTDSTLISTLKLMEKISARVADHVILANHIWLDRYTKRSAPAQKCSVFLNHVDQHIFVPQPRRQRSDGPIVIYPGGLQRHQGVDIAIRAFSSIASRLPDAKFHIYGDGAHKAELVALVDELKLQHCIKFFEPLSLRAIAQVMADADLGVAPKRADTFGDEAYSTKIMEFMSVGVPVIASDARINKYYFDDSVVCYFASGNESELAEKIHLLLTDPSLRAAQIESANRYVRQNSWDQHKGDYMHLVDQLVAT